MYVLLVIIYYILVYMYVNNVSFHLRNLAIKICLSVWYVVPDSYIIQVKAFCNVVSATTLQEGVRSLLQVTFGVLVLWFYSLPSLNSPVYQVEILALTCF